MLEIIPRLVLAHRSSGEGPDVCVERGPPSDEEVAEFARIAANGDLDAALAFIEQLAAAGVGLEYVFMQVIAPAARLLGEQWAQDLCSFSAVTAGVGLMQRLVQVLGPAFAPQTPHRGLCVLIASPGEQHTLGLFLLGEHLRRAGWGVELVPGMTREELISLVASTEVKMVGFSVSVPDHLVGLAKAISAVRAGSRNPQVEVLVGGSLDLGDFAAANQVVHLTSPTAVIDWMERLSRSHSSPLVSEDGQQRWRRG